MAAATSVFTLVHRVVSSPLPYPEADRLVLLDHGATELDFSCCLGMTYGFFRFYGENLRTVESSALYSWTTRTLTGEGEPLRADVLSVTPSLAQVLGVRPAAGRWFTEAEGGPGEAAVTMLSHAFWRTRFGGDRGVVGRTILLDDVPHEVVGVLPGSLTAPFDGAALFVPREVPATGIGGWNAMAVARMTPEATPGQVAREMADLLPRLRASTDDPVRVRGYLDDADVFPVSVSLKESVVGDVRATLWVLLGTVGVVLLIAVANVANLFLVRSEEGQRESAVRAALGAGRARLARGFLAETGLIAAAACALGVGAAALAVRVLRERAPVDVPRLAEVRLDPTSIGVAALVCLAAALLLALAPLLRLRRDGVATLHDVSARATASRHRLRGRSVLVTAQVALALVLLVGSGLLFRTFQALRAVDLGFSERSALTFRVGLAPTVYDRDEAIRFHDALLERLTALPGVVSASPRSSRSCWARSGSTPSSRTTSAVAPPRSACAWPSERARRTCAAWSYAREVWRWGWARRWGSSAPSHSRG